MRKKLIQLAAVALATMALGLAQPKPPAAPKAKGVSKQEAEAMNAVFKAKTPDEVISAAENFITKFADSEFKPQVLEAAAEAAERKNDSAKAIFYADKALEASPQYVPALNVVALELAGHTRENDLDKDEKLTKAEKDAKEALDLLPNEAKPSYVTATDAQWEASKKEDAALAHVALGLVATVRKKYDDAAKELQTAVDDEAKPDPTHLIRLADAYNKAGKHDEALAVANKLLAMADLPDAYKKFAEQEKDEAERSKSGKK
jgi:tetratricopeptide (TPR) repeat protein